MPDIIARIDEALQTIEGLSTGYSEYSPLLKEFDKAGGGAQARATLRERIIDLSARRYRRYVTRKVELLTFNDGAYDFLFDYTLERTVLIHGVTKSAAKNSRDESYHKGYPSRGGYDKGHGMSHAQGGQDGGPNYFYQQPWVNRRLPKVSLIGGLWRDIKTYLAANAGTFAFVRLMYNRSNKGDVPNAVEYGLLNGDAQFRAVIFPN
jgi:hypothetical protein